MSETVSIRQTDKEKFREIKPINNRQPVCITVCLYGC